MHAHLLGSSLLLGLILSRTFYYYIAFESNQAFIVGKNQPPIKKQNKRRVIIKVPPTRWVPPSRPITTLVSPGPYRVPLPEGLSENLKQQIWTLLKPAHFPACAVVVIKNRELATQFETNQAAAQAAVSMAPNDTGSPAPEKTTPPSPTEESTEETPPGAATTATTPTPATNSRPAIEWTVIDDDRVAMNSFFPVQLMTSVSEWLGANEHLQLSLFQYRLVQNDDENMITSCGNHNVLVFRATRTT
jgi:hypothetical protein